MAFRRVSFRRVTLSQHSVTFFVVFLLVMSLCHLIPSILIYVTVINFAVVSTLQAVPILF